MSKQPSTRIVIADDHPLFRGALRQAVSSAIGGAEVSEVGSIEALTEALDSSGDADLVLLDLTMPGVQGFSGLMSLRAQYPELPVMIVSATEEPTVIRRAMDFGASGFIPKSVDVDSIGEAIKAVLAWQIEQAMKAQKLSKSAMAQRMGTSRAQLDRLLDPDNTSVTLHTLQKAAATLGRKVRLELV